MVRNPIRNQIFDLRSRDMYLYLDKIRDDLRLRSHLQRKGRNMS